MKKMEKFLEEINERYKANQKQIDFHNKELRTLYDNEQALIKEFCDGLCKKYAEFIGKYVKVKFKDSFGHEREADGFLLGFAYHKGFNIGIYPSIAKRKKDGTPSKVEHPTWDIMPFMCITSIEIIDTTPEM